MEALTPKLERVLKAWKPGTIPTTNIPAVPALATDQLYIIDRPGAEQSIIISGQLIAPKKNPNEFAFTMFNDAFGGAFGSRVNLNLREDKHWSYGAASATFDARGQRMWVVYAPVQTDKTRESVSVRDRLPGRLSPRGERDRPRGGRAGDRGRRWFESALVQYAEPATGPIVRRSFPAAPHRYRSCVVCKRRPRASHFALLWNRHRHVSPRAWSATFPRELRQPGSLYRHWHRSYARRASPAGSETRYGLA